MCGSPLLLALDGGHDVLVVQVHARRQRRHAPRRASLWASAWVGGNRTYSSQQMSSLVLHHTSSIVCL